MNYIDKFTSAALNSISGKSVDFISTDHGQSDVVTVDDAHLLFSGDYRRSGPDLILSKDGHELLVHDYFRGEKRAALASPDGASLSGKTIEALTGYVQYAQAGAIPNTAAKDIGQVTKLVGSATAIRNGVSIQLNMGDRVYKGDVVQSGGDSSLGITFIDGTVFGLSSNARMVLNEMIYDPAGSNNSSLLSLVQGTITFVAGETAKRGDMKVDTPVATMGIRGTAVLVEIGFEVPGQGGAPPVKFQVLVEPGNVVGSYVLYSKSDPNIVIGTVNQAGQVTSVTGLGNISQQQAPPLSPEATAVIQQTLQAYFPSYVPDAPKPNNANPQSNPSGNSSAPATPVPGGSDPDKLPINVPAGQPILAPITIPLQTPTPENPAATTPTQIQVTITRFNTEPTVVVAPVANPMNFKIADQVSVTDPDIADPAFNDIVVPYVAGSGKVLSVVGATNPPAGVNLVGLIHLNPETGAVSYDPSTFAFLKANEPVVVTIGFDTRSGPSTVHETLTFTIDGVNDAPVVSTKALGISYAEKQPAIAIDPALVVFDVDSPNLVGARVSITGVFQAGQDVLGFVNTAKISGVYDSATGVLMLSGTATVAEYQAALRSVTYVSNSNNAVSGARLIDFQVDDGTAADHASNVAVAIVAVAAIDDLPIIANATLIVSEGGTVALTSANFSFVDFDSPNVSYAISNLAGGRFEVLSGGSWTETTSFGSVEVAAGNVRFVHNGGETAPAFSVTANDGVGNGPTIAGTVIFTNLNDAPIVTAAALAVTEGATVIVTTANLGFSDPDNSGVIYTVSNLTHGTFQLLVGVVWLAATAFSSDDVAAGHVRFVHDGGETAPTFSVSASDAGGGISGPVVGSLAFGNVNDAPILTPIAPVLTTIAANDIANNGQSVGSLIGANIFDPDAGAVHGIAITGASGLLGTWQFSIDGGSHWTNFAGYTATSALLLSDTDRVRFVPDGVSSGTASFAYRGWDETAGSHGDTANATAAGGASAFSLASDTASLTIATVVGLTRIGDAGDNVLLGDAGADTLTGLAGNDVLQGFAGNDLLDGGAGRDFAVYTDATAGIAINLASGIVIGNVSVGTDTLRSIEYVRGGNFADHYDATGFSTTSVNASSITSGSVNNGFEGMGGDDVVTGNGGTQLWYSRATAGVTVDLRDGFAHGTAASDLASVGSDSFTGVNSVRGSAYGDFLYGSNNATRTDVFYGGSGNDFIDGRGGFDLVVYSSAIEDTVTSGITVDLAAGTVTGDASVGTDTLRGVEIIRGTQFADAYTAAGFGGNSTNAGSSGNFNDFEGMGGNDSIIGNGGTRISYTQASAAVTVDLGIGTAQDSADAANDTTLDLADVGTDTIVGGVNQVRGSDFNDRLLGSNTTNIFVVENFYGGKGNDFINGRGGLDRAIYSTTSDDPITGGIVVKLALGTVTGDASVGVDTLRSVEFIRGSSFADLYDAIGFSGTSANQGSSGTFNEFEGVGGDDFVNGNGNTRIAFYSATAGVTVNLTTGTVDGDASVGHDTIGVGVNAVAGSQFDDLIHGSNNLAGTTQILEGRGGDDLLDGRGGYDQAVYYIDQSVTAGVTIDMASGIVTGDAAVGTDTLRSIESVIGTRFADTYDATGFGNSDHLDGLTNNVGEFGAFNEFQGYGGNDVITGNGETQITYYAASAGVTVDLQAGTAIGDISVGIDTFTSVYAVRGSSFGDIISGDANANLLDGQGGNDRLDGRGGVDVLFGGTGADTFVYAAGYGDDFVADFKQIENDRIDLTGVAGIYSLADLQLIATQVGANTLIDFGGGDTLTLGGVTKSSLAAADFLFNILSPPVTSDVTVTGIEDNDTSFNLSSTGSAARGYVFDTVPATSIGVIQYFAGNSLGTVAVGAEIPADSSFYFMPAANWNGIEVFQYHAVGLDGAPDVTPNNLTFQFTAVNDAPTLAASAQSALLIDGGPDRVGSDSASRQLSIADIDGIASYDISTWTQLSATTFRKDGVYGSAVLDTSNQTLIYTLDSARTATAGLADGQRVNDSIDITLTDGSAAVTVPVQFEVIGTAKLTTADDEISPSSTPSFVATNSSTFNSGDSLDGGQGTDTLALYGNGAFNLNSLSQFAGFEEVRLFADSRNFSQYGITLHLRDNANPSMVTTVYGSDKSEFFVLSSGSEVIHGGAGDDEFQLSSPGLIGGNDALDGGAGGRDWLVPTANMDLTTLDLQKITSVESLRTGPDLIINQAILTFFKSEVYGGGSLTTNDTALDVSAVNLSNFYGTLASGNTTGTAFTVGGYSQAVKVIGGSGQDSIVANGFTFTENERTNIYAIAPSIEKIVDSTGEYLQPVASRLTTSTDVISANPGDLVLYALPGTLNATDSLDGGCGYDVLYLFGNATYNLNSLSQFAGFEEVRLFADSRNFSQYGIALHLRDNADPSVVTTVYGSDKSEFFVLSTGSEVIYGGAGDDEFQLSSPGLIGGNDALDGGAGGRDWLVPTANMDLTTLDLQKITSVESLRTGPDLIINQAILTFFKSEVYGGGSLTTNDTALDVSAVNLSNFNGTLASGNTTGTAFTVGSYSQAVKVIGGSGQDSIVANGFTFTEAERNSIFQERVETVTDASGTYHSASYIPDNHAPAFTGFELPIDPNGTSVSSAVGDHYSDADNQTLLGIAISHVDADPETQGVWQYGHPASPFNPVGNPAVWTDIEPNSVSEQLALAIPYSTSLRFVPVADYSGTPSLTAYALDSNSDLGSGAPSTYINVTQHGGTTHISNSATISAPEGAGPANSTPVAVDDHIIVAASAFDDGALSIDNQILTANDTDADGDVPFVDGYPESVFPAYGSVHASNTGTATNYQLADPLPGEDDTLVDSFRYTIADQFAASAPATVNLTIVGPDVSGVHTLSSTAGNDILIGGLTESTEFFSFVASSGRDTVLNFDSGTDKILINYGYEETNSETWLSGRTEVINGDTLVHLDVSDSSEFDGQNDHNTILLKGIASVHANDFILYAMA